MVQQNKLLIYHRKLLGRKGHVIEGCIIIRVPVRATNVPLGFRGDFGSSDTARETQDTKGDIGHHCIKAYYGLIICNFLFYFAYNNVINHII